MKFTDIDRRILRIIPRLFCLGSVALIVGLVASCASKPPPRTLNPTLGMSSEEVRSILGNPDAEFDSEFGHESENGEWTGRVWLYFGPLDSRYRFVKRRFKDTYVFYPPDEEMQLNHWIREIPQPNPDR